MENNYILDYMNITGYMGSNTRGPDCMDILMHAVWLDEYIGLDSAPPVWILIILLAPFCFMDLSDLNPVWQNACYIGFNEIFFTSHLVLFSGLSLSYTASGLLCRRAVGIGEGGGRAPQ